MSDFTAFVDGSVADIPCRILLDTGSPVSILSSSFVHRNGLSGKVTEANKCILRGIAGGKVVMDGKIIVEVKLGKSHGKLDAWVADVEDDVLVGMDFLKARGCILDLRGEFLQIQES